MAEENSIKDIFIKGARVHNLKNIDVRIPRGKLVVFTGISGSGKSSLAFDTLYAEGVRQYIESLSAKVRGNFDVIPAPDVDYIHGLSPVIAVEQMTAGNGNPRATVATVTEIADYAQLLWAFGGEAFCPDDGAKIIENTLDDSLARLEKLPEGTKLILCAPHTKIKANLLEECIDNLRRRGFQRIRINKEIFDLDDIKGNAFKGNLEIDIIIDRIVWNDSQKSRLADSLEFAFKEGQNVAIVLIDGGEQILRLNLSCSCCGKIYEQLTSKHFSANHPLGACPSCGGMGRKMMFQQDLVIRDVTLSIKDGAIKAWRYGSKKMITQRRAWLKQLSEQYPFDLKTPWKDLSENVQHFILYGDKERSFLMKDGRRKPSMRLFEGVLADLEKTASTTKSELLQSRLLVFQISAPCPDCHGTRLNKRVQSVYIKGLSIGQFYEMSLDEALRFIISLKGVFHVRNLEDARLGLEKRLSFLTETGLSYLTSNRVYNTLSGGESQRVRLATQLGLGLLGVTYILDEPSIGLHPIDHKRLLESLKKLRDNGNSVLVVEHDKETILEADYLIEIGPGAGINGGELIFSGTIDEAKKDKKSFLGKYLRGEEEVEFNMQKSDPGVKRFLKIKAAAENNLKSIDVDIPIGEMTVVCGVSGSGKSTLINDILGNYAAVKINRAKIIPGKHGGIEGLENFKSFVRVDQEPIGRSPRSNPATFTGVFDHLRKVFAKTLLAKMRAYDAGRFSFNKRGGRCEVCRGEGYISMDMQFLGETWIACPSCQKQRYNRETLEVLFKGKNIAQVLDMTIEEAAIFFRSHLSIKSVLDVLNDVGLGYLRLGQSAITLSGGEAQRLKLSLELAKGRQGQTLYILDEPTTGLHWKDIQLLKKLLFKLRDAGNTLIVIEHNSDIIRSADYLLELGPEGGKNGGQLIFKGTPVELKKQGKTPTSLFL